VNTTKTSSLRTIMAVVFALAIGALCMGFAPATAQADNLADAKAKYGVSDDAVVTVNDNIDIKTALEAASKEVSVSGKAIAYIPSGEYTISSTLIVPENVVLVGEKGATILTQGALDKPNVVRLNGSLYGLTIDDKKKNGSSIKLMAVYSGINGHIDYVTVKNAGEYGVYGGSETKNAVITYSTVTGSKKSGICVSDGGNISVIDHCDVSGNGVGGEGAGINLSCANVGKITYCTLNNNTDKPVSTNCMTSKAQNGCTIGLIDHCVMNNNKKNGVHIKPYCTLNGFTNNTVKGNNNSGLSAVADFDGNKGASVIKNVAGNTFDGNQLAQMKSIGKGASIEVRDNNKFLNSKNASGIEAADGGAITVTGTNNVVTGNKGAGINVSDKGKLTISGSKNSVTGNKGYGVFCSKGTLAVKGANNTFASSSSACLYIAKSGKVTITGKSNKVSSSKNYGVYAKKGTLQVTGKSNSFTAKKKNAIYACGKSKVTITGAKSVITGKGYAVVAKDKGTKVTIKKAKKLGKTAAKSKAKVVVK